MPVVCETTCACAVMPVVCCPVIQVCEPKEEWVVVVGTFGEDDFYGFPSVA